LAELGKRIGTVNVFQVVAGVGRGPVGDVRVLGGGSGFYDGE